MCMHTAQRATTEHQRRNNNKTTQLGGKTLAASKRLGELQNRMVNAHPCSCTAASFRCQRVKDPIASACHVRVNLERIRLDGARRGDLVRPGTYGCVYISSEMRASKMYLIIRHAWFKLDD